MASQRLRFVYGTVSVRSNIHPRRFDSTDKEVNSVVEIPGDAKMLEKQFPGVVKVLAPRKDFGPATKLLPTLEVETDPETIIITVDVSFTSLKYCSFCC
jgi:hypothetical protein